MCELAAYTIKPVGGQSARLLRFLILHQHGRQVPMKEIIDYVFSDRDDGGPLDAYISARRLMSNLRKALKSHFEIWAIRHGRHYYYQLVDTRDHVEKIHACLRDAQQAQRELTIAAQRLEDKARKIRRELNATVRDLESLLHLVAAREQTEK